MHVKIAPFSEADLEEASELLARRHQGGRATNLLSSHFWPRQGFRPVAYRLSRCLDERILWGHANTSPFPWLDRRFTNEQA